MIQLYLSVRDNFNVTEIMIDRINLFICFHIQAQIPELKKENLKALLKLGKQCLNRPNY